jgi:septum site-determining protein MinC
MVMTAVAPATSFQFCGRSFLAFVLKPKMPIAEWIADADKWLARSPGFFSGKPVVVDVSGLLLSKDHAAELIADLGMRDIRVMGMLGIDDRLIDPALPPLLSPAGKTEFQVASEKPDPHNAPDPEPSATVVSASSLLVDSPVRSGQSLFHEGDVTVIGSVSSGAEIVATGSIHIYGTLRGRVLAGVDGNAKAHIFCRRLEAELIAIDGYYRMSDDISSFLGKNVHAWLEDGALTIKALN